MQQFIHGSKAEVMNIIKKGTEEAKLKIQEEINRQVPLLRAQLKSEGMSHGEIEEIIKEACEEQYKISMLEFNKTFLIEEQKIFPSRGKIVSAQRKK